MVLAAACTAGVLLWTMWPRTSGPQFDRLVGRWLRPDGGYVLQVSGVAEDGTATVSYFNPRSIRVATAQARREGADIGLVVKFDDANYRGSTYTLAYDPTSDQLKGNYFQAAEGANFDVYFTRQR